MSTSSEQPESTERTSLLTEFDEIFNEVENKKDEQISRLQDELTQVKDAIREERFIFIMIIVVILNVIFFSFIENVAGPVVLLILQILLLIPLARRMGVEEISLLLDRLLARIATSLKGQDE